MTRSLVPVLVTPPAELPVSLVEAKAQIAAVEFADDDALVSSLIEAATAHLDGWAGILGRCLVTQSWRVDLGCWPASGCIRLPFPDVQSIISIVYSDADDAEQTLDDSLYGLFADGLGGFVRLRKAFSAPSLYDDRPDAVRVTFVAGFGDAAAVPAAIRTAILMLVGHWYQNREAVVVGQVPTVAELPLGVDALLAPYRRVGA